jgi:hypothetical protein
MDIFFVGGKLYLVEFLGSTLFFAPYLARHFTQSLKYRSVSGIGAFDETGF